MKKADIKEGDRVTILGKKPHEYVTVLKVYDSYFTGVCHSGNYMNRSLYLDWLIWNGK